MKGLGVWPLASSGWDYLPENKHMIKIRNFTPTQMFLKYNERLEIVIQLPRAKGFTSYVYTHYAARAFLTSRAIVWM